MCTGVFIVYFLFIGAVIAGDENQAKLRYYHGSMENYTELTLDEADAIFSTTWYDPSKITVFYTHGFTGYPEGPAVKAVINTYLELGNSNVVLLNWDKLAALALHGLLNSYINWAMPNCIQLGADFSETLQKLSAAGLNLNNTHMVGHSLGAHIFGIAGTKLLKKGIQLPWITGLDPATGFDMKPAALRLNPNAARLVVALHSDPHKYGSKKELGVVDFWPNFRGFGSALQPGCPTGNHPIFSTEEFCSHNRCWQYFIDALKYPGSIIGSYAKSYKTWKRYTKEERQAVVMPLGEFRENVVPGNYYFITAPESPYGLAEEGL